MLVVIIKGIVIRTGFGACCLNMCEYFDFEVSFLENIQLFLFFFLAWVSLSLHYDIIKKHGWGVRAHKYYKIIYSYKMFGVPIYIIGFAFPIIWFLSFVIVHECKV